MKSSDTNDDIEKFLIKSEDSLYCKGLLHPLEMLPLKKGLAKIHQSTFVWIAF